MWVQEWRGKISKFLKVVEPDQIDEQESSVLSMNIVLVICTYNARHIYALKVNSTKNRMVINNEMKLIMKPQLVVTLGNSESM